MRTDVKVGLICVFVLVLAVVAYFAFPPASKNEPVGSSTPKGLTTDTNPPKSDSGVAVAPPSTPPSTPTFTGPGSTPSLNGAGPAAGSLATGNTPAPASSPAGSLLIGAPTENGTTPPPTTGPAAALGGGTLGSPGALAGGPSPAPGLLPPPAAPSGLTVGRGPVDIERPAPGTDAPRGILDVPGTGEPPSRGSSIIPAPAPASGGAASTYTIAKGDMLYAIAKKNHVTVKALEAANPGINPTRLLVGAKIHIPAPTPASTSSRTPASPSSRTPASAGSGRSATSSTASTRSPARSATSPTAGSSYTVKKGDTLRTIAKAAYGDENMWRRIARINRGTLPNPSKLTAGKVLRLPPR